MEPPAVVAFVANPDYVIIRAVRATFLDLIARGFLKRADAAGGESFISIAAVPDPTLLPYERHVYDHIAQRVAWDGAGAPEGALRLESTEHAERWMEAFVAQVEHDALERGLVTEGGVLSSMASLTRVQLSDLGKQQLAAYEALRASLAEQVAGASVGSGLLDRSAAYAMTARRTRLRSLKSPRSCSTGCDLATGCGST